MSGSGDVVAAIRRVGPFVLWAVASTVWILLLRIFWPDSKAFEYFQTPIYIGVMLIAGQVIPRRYAPWLPVLIGAAVSLAVTLSWKALL